MTRVEYHEAASAELEHEIAYLDQIDKTYGDALIAEVLHVEELIATYPASGAEFMPGIRKHSTRGFRYSLFYALEIDCAVIYAFAHDSRKPLYWADRLEPEA